MSPVWSVRKDMGCLSQCVEGTRLNSIDEQETTKESKAGGGVRFAFYVKHYSSDGDFRRNGSKKRSVVSRLCTK